jgi:hypothetical protein
MEIDKHDPQLIEDAIKQEVLNKIEMNPIFDYNLITEEHKKVVKEITTLLDQHGQEMLSELIKLKFKIVENPKFNLKESIFMDVCKKAEIIPIIQGFTLDNGVEYPVVLIQDDIRKLDSFVANIRAGSY